MNTDGVDHGAVTVSGIKSKSTVFMEADVISTI